MRGKQAVVVYMAVLFLTACTFSPADAVESSREMSKAEAEKKQTAEQGENKEPNRRRSKIRNRRTHNFWRSMRSL